MLNHFTNVHITLIGDDAFTVIIQQVFCFLDDAFHIGYLFHLFHDFFITFEQLDGIESFQGWRYILQFCRNVIECAFHFRCEGMLGGAAFSCRRFHSRFCRFFHTSAFQRGNLHHFAAQFFGKTFHVDFVTILFHNVHHIDGNHNGNAQFCQLCSQIQVSFQISAVNDVQNPVGSFPDEVISCHHFFQCIGRKGVYARQVHDGHFFVAFELPFFFLYGYPGPVPHKLVGACQCVKQCGLAAVGVPGKRNLHAHVVSPSYSLVTPNSLPEKMARSHEPVI